MNRHILFVLLIACITLFSCADKNKDYTIAFYNVENLFDTIDDTTIWDEDFTPNGKLQYTADRYQKKLDNLSSVISSIKSNDFPSVIGLCEVENRAVLEALVNQDKLKDANYGIAHTDSPDGRGIDCALLYNKKEFNYIGHEVIPINYTWEEKYKTRDILHVKGTLADSDTLHFFVNHWPSRRGGLQVSEKKRVFVAEQLRLAVDKLQDKNPNAKIIIMGDFNDEPDNRSVTEALLANNDKQAGNPKALYNLMYDLQQEGKGTYSYKNNWNMLDNLIVSNSLINNPGGLQTTYESGKIFTEEWICYKSDDGTFLPSRSYAGPMYYGGYSDHFPVHFQLSKN